MKQATINYNCCIYIYTIFSIHLYLFIFVRSEDESVGTGQALRRSLLLLLRSLCDRQRRKALAPGTWWLVPELRSLLQEGRLDGDVYHQAMFEKSPAHAALEQEHWITLGFEVRASPLG